MAPTVEFMSLNGNWGLKGTIPPSLFNSVNHNTAFGWKQAETSFTGSPAT